MHISSSISLFLLVTIIIGVFFSFLISLHKCIPLIPGILISIKIKSTSIFKISSNVFSNLSIIKTSYPLFFKKLDNSSLILTSSSMINILCICITFLIITKKELIIKSQLTVTFRNIN